MLICKRIFHKKLEIGSVEFKIVTYWFTLEFSNPKQTHIELNLARNVADFVLTCKRNITDRTR